MSAHTIPRSSRGHFVKIMTAILMLGVGQVHQTLAQSTIRNFSSCGVASQNPFKDKDNEEWKRNFDATVGPQLKKCWNGSDVKSDYTPAICVQFTIDGHLAAQPFPMRTHFEPKDQEENQTINRKALTALEKCMPIHIDEKLRPYYDQWKNFVILFH